MANYRAYVFTMVYLDEICPECRGKVNISGDKIYSGDDENEIICLECGWSLTINGRWKAIAMIELHKHYHGLVGDDDDGYPSGSLFYRLIAPEIVDEIKSFDNRIMMLGNEISYLRAEFPNDAEKVETKLKEFNRILEEEHAFIEKFIGGKL